MATMGNPKGERRSGNPIAHTPDCTPLVGRIATPEGAVSEDDMGVFKATMRVGNMQGGTPREVELIVDTGACHSVFPKAFLESLGIKMPLVWPVRLADGKEDNWEYGQAVFEHDGVQLVCSVLAGPSDEMILGASTMENFGLTVNMREHRLETARTQGRPL